MAFGYLLKTVKIILSNTENI